MYKLTKILRWLLVGVSFSILLYKTWLPILLHIGSVFYVLCLLLFLYQRVFLKNFWGFSMSKHLTILKKKCFAKSRSEYGKYGPRSVYGFLRTGCRPIRLQDSLKPYNNMIYHLYVAQSRYKQWNFIFQDKFLIHNHKKCNWMAFTLI